MVLLTFVCREGPVRKHGLFAPSGYPGRPDGTGQPFFHYIGKGGPVLEIVDNVDHDSNCTHTVSIDETGLTFCCQAAYDYEVARYEVKYA